ncbi:conjugal transfer protein TrbL family protein [Gottfriedia solisilvae]|uniref:conjugal transfer protein TrbL family protein n=1 Tax=Gottfriedia solisilvae TaxID=1516104 RepID=UPI003D2F0A7C
MKYIRKLIVIPLILMTFLVISPSLSYAKEGDFYKKYQSEFDKRIIDPNMIDLVKNYDYKTNSFDCGWTEFTCKVNSIGFQMSLGALKFAYGGLKYTVITPESIMRDEDFKKYKQALGTLSTSMLALFFLWSILSSYAKRFADPSDGFVVYNDKILLTVVACIILFEYDQVFTYLLKFQQYAVSGIIRETIDNEELVKTLFIYGAEYGMMIAFLIAAILLIFSAAYMYRFALFGLMYMVGPVAIPTITNETYNFFNTWLGIIINNGVTLFLQVLCFSIGLRRFLTVGENPLLGIVFFFLALAIPGLLGSFGGGTGTARMGSEVAKHLMRRR